MKVILSRKGMDSSWGGHPGIILPDNTILYYPIPGDEDEDRYSDIKGTDGIAMNIGMKRFYQDILYMDAWNEITDETHCHMAAIDIQTGAVLEGYLPPKALAMVREWSAIHKDDLLHMWETQEFKPLSPLE